MLVVYGSMMIAYLRLLLKLSYKKRRKRRWPPSYTAALNVLTMTIINEFDFIYLFVNCIH